MVIGNFTLSGPSLIAFNLPLVYRHYANLWVRNWYITYDAENVESFNTLISCKNLRKFEKNGEFFIVSTHFGKGFTVNSDVHPITKRLLKELSERDCWFAPVTDILGFYVANNPSTEIRKLNLLWLEIYWFYDSVKRRLKRKDYTATESQFIGINQ